MEFENRDLYDSTRNYAEKSDILRHQLLKDFGGVYIDIDIKCLKPLDTLHHLYDAYFGLEFPLSDWTRPIIAPGIMASAPRHKVVVNILKYIRKNWDITEDRFDNGEYNFYGRSFHSLGIYRSMKPVTDVFLEEVTLDDNVIALPATYFYPIHYFSLLPFWDTLDKRIKRKFYSILSSFVNIESRKKLANYVYKHLDNKSVFLDIKPESFSYHDYFEAGSTVRYIGFSDAFGFYDQKFLSYYTKMSHQDRVRFSMFEQFYNKNHFHNIKLNIKPKINKIHFIDIENNAKEQTIVKFKEHNKDTEVFVWNSEEIAEEFPGIFAKLGQFTNKDDRDFYLGLKIILKHGGLYINQSNLESLQSVEEVNNRYDLYAGFLPITPDNLTLKIDGNFIASKANHWILQKAMTEIETLLAKGHSFDISTLMTTYIYKYQDLNGKNIVFPPMYFHPLTKNYKETIKYRIKRFYYGYKPAFQNPNEYISFTLNK